MAKAVDPSQVAQVIITDPLDGHPELLEGSFILACRLAQMQSLPLGVKVEEPLRGELLASLSTSARSCLVDQGEAEFLGVKLVELKAENHLISFTGITLLIGVDSVRLKVLDRLQAATIVIAVPRTDTELHGISMACPNAGHAHLQVQPEMPELSESQKSNTQWFDDRYILLKNQSFNTKSDIERLGKGQTKICRYCKENKITLFSNISHAFPEQIGNKKVVDLLECDSCNKHFATMLDDHFGKWSLPNRTTGRIKGKHKVPSYRSDDQKFRIDYKNASGLTIKVRDGDERVKLDTQAKEMHLLFERQPYVPMAIFKSFVKMALAVMPELEASECTHLKKWILETKHSFESFRYKPLMLFTQFIPGNLPNDNVNYFVLKRKVGVTDCPYLQFVLHYSNYVYQIALPMPHQDLPEGLATLKFSYFPHPWDTPEHEKEYGRCQKFETDMSSPDVKKDDSLPISLAFESALEISPKLGI